MSVKQISVFLENRQGALADFCTLLGEEKIDLIALSIADTTDFGLLRAITGNSEAMLRLAKKKGYTAKVTEVLAVAVPDEPGGLAVALNLLRNAGISVEYLYSLVRRINRQAIIVFRVDKPAEAERIFKRQNLRLLGQDEIEAACSL
jgi:hypothetical protein